MSLIKLEMLVAVPASGIGSQCDGFGITLENCVSSALFAEAASADSEGLSTPTLILLFNVPFTCVLMKLGLNHQDQVQLF